jgi:lysyl oxidase
LFGLVLLAAATAAAPSVAGEGAGGAPAAGARVEIVAADERAASAPVAGAPAAAPLLPNLRTLAPRDFVVDREHGRRLLRMTTTIANVGRGPVELKPRKADCNGDGDPENDRAAVQRIYQDADGDGVFRPRVDRARSARRVGCFRFHRRHVHWHFKNFASYELARLSDGAVVASHDKVGFCLVDSLVVDDGLPGAPRSGVYRSCEPDAVQGLSVGYGDVYGRSLPGQFVDISGLPDGGYCLRSTVDPANKLDEARERDNSVTQALRLVGLTVTALSDPC